MINLTFPKISDESVEYTSFHNKIVPGKIYNYINSTPMKISENVADLLINQQKMPDSSMNCADKKIK